MGRGSAFLNHLIQQGLLQQQQAPPPVQPRAVMPADIAQAHNLPTTDPLVVSQMYQDTRPAQTQVSQLPPPPASSPLPSVNYQQTPQQQAWMAWQASTARQFITDPSELANADAQMYARIYPPEAAPGLGQQAKDVGSSIVSNVVAPVVKVLGGTPITPTSPLLDEHAGGDKYTATAGDVVAATGAPEQKWYDMQMQVGIEMANNGGQMPTWAKIVYGDVPGQGVIPKWAPGNAQANDQWFLPSYLQAHPEALATVKQISDDATAAGEDPTEAVGKWWEAQQGLLLNMASRGINDPLNLAAGAGAISRVLEGAALGSEVAGDASKANRLRVASQVVGAADKAINAPWELIDNIIERGSAWGGRAAARIPDNLNIFAPSANQVARDAEADTMSVVASAEDLAQRRASGEGGIPREEAIRRAQAQGLVVGEPPPVNPDIGPTPLENGAVAGVPPTDVSQLPPPPGVGPTPLENGPTAAQLPTLPEMDYGLPGAPPRVSPPEDAIYRTQSGAEYPAGWSSKAPEVAPQDAYGRGQLVAQARVQFPEQTRIAEDALKDWRETYYEPMNNAASTEGALNWAAPVNKRTGVPGEGYGKTLLPILDADYETRLRLNLEAQGVDTSRMTWRTKPEYTAPIADENLVARGYDPNVTRKDMTMEARMDQYIRTTDPTGVMVTTKNGASRSLEQWLLDNQVIRKTEGTTDADRAAFFRYQYAQQQRQRLQLLREPGRLDQFFADANIPAPRAVPNAQDIAKLPTTETQTTWGNAWGASVTDVLNAAPSDVQAEVSRVLADKVDELHLDRYDLMTPRQQALSDIDYSVAMSQELAKRGVAVPRPPAVWNNPGDNLGTTIRSLVFAPENDAFHANIDRLIEQGVLSETTPASSMYMLDRPGYLKQKQAYQLYSDIFRYRDAVNGEALRVVTPPSPPALRAEKVMVGKKVTWQAVNDADGTVMETFPRRKDALQYIDEQTARANDITHLNARTTTKPPAPVLGPYTTTLSQEKFDEVVGRTMASPSIGDLRGHGDGLIADALATGMIDEDTARVASRIVHLPAVGKTPARDITVMDLVLEKMYAFDDMNTVKRAVGSDVAEANKIARSVKDAVTNDILRAEGVTQAEAKGILRWLDEGTGFVKENLLMSPARAASAGMQDATGNALFQLITGHANAAAKTLVNPTAWWSLMKHNMRAVEFAHPTMELLKEAGVNLPHGVIDIQTREMFEVGSKTRLERLIGKTGVPEGAAGRISGIVASKWARAWRHAIDQNARLNLFGDVFRTGLRKAQGDFLLHVRSVVDNPDEANRIVRELGWAEKKAFSPEDVRRVTGRNDFAREYRTRIEALSKEAHDEVLRVHFTYRNTKADEVTRRILLFHYWQSRAVLFYPKTVLGNPYLLNLHYKMWKSLADEAQRQDAGNPLNLMFDVMAGDGGIYAQFDPIHAIVPYVVSQTFGINYAGESGFDRWQRKFGVYVNPFIQAAMIVVGQSTSRVDLTGTSALRTLITRTIDYARNHGYVIDNPGITKDYVQDVENRVLEIINSGVRAAFPGVPDYNVPDLTKTAQTQVNAIIVANAERDFDIQFADMTTEQKEEVLAAEIAVRTGQDDNDRANEAMAQYSTVGLAGAWWKALPTPFGNTQIRSEDVDQHRADVDAAYASLNAGQLLTPAEQSALDADSLIRTGSQAAGTLDIENDAYRSATSDFENTIAEGYNLIAFGQVDPGAYEDIGGKRYYGWQINEMGKDQRDKLATAWVLQNGGAGALKSYKDKRAKVVDSSTELKGYKDYTKRASNYNGGEQYKENDINRVMDYTGGGMRDFRNYLENGSGNGPSNPNFARAIQAQRVKLQAQGYSGEDLETRLDSWAYTTDAYNAYRGTKGSISDPNPITTNATDNQLTAAGPGETAPAESGGTGSGGTKKPKADTSARPATYQGYSGDWDATGNRPQWQSDLAAEVDTYQQAIAKFEAEYGSVQNFTMHPEVVERYLPKPSNDMQAYLNWADQEQRSGGDGSFQAYLAYKDAQYAERYPAKKKDTKDTTEPTPVFIPAWQQASP